MGAALLITLMAGCRLSQEDRYQRYVEDVADSTFEYITPPADSVSLEEDLDAEVEKGAWADDDGLVAVPDIPKERKVDMSASNYDAIREMTGKGGQ